MLQMYPTCAAQQQEPGRRPGTCAAAPQLRGANSAGMFRIRFSSKVLQLDYQGERADRVPAGLPGGGG
jgi:hypothetical protein